MPIMFIFAPFYKHISIMKKELLTDFVAFRRWFNANFKLSLNGKFAGLCRVKNWQLLAYRLYKILNGYYRKVYSQRIVINLHSQRCVLYMF